MGRRSKISRAFRIDGISRGARLHHVWHDALSGDRERGSRCATMFEFFFRYPARVFSKGDFVLLSGWPKWILCILLVGAAAALGWRIYSRIRRAEHNLKYWQAAVIWLVEARSGERR